MISPEAKEVSQISARLRASTRFLSQLMAGSPTHDTVAKWLRGEPSLNYETGLYLLHLCQALEQECKRAPVPINFRAASAETARLWRALLFKSGRIAVRFKKQDADRLFGRREFRNEGLAGETVAEPETVKA